jgi:hypothetical protein
VRCVQCGSPFVAQAQTIVDARDEAARRALLSERLNVARCPSCGTANRLAVPLLYHDAERELAYVLVPETGAGGRAAEERQIGQLTNRLLDSLPPEDRKMYLLQPRQFVTEASFRDALLEASGISSDALAGAQAQVALVVRLARTAAGDPGDEALQAVLAAEGREADYGLLLLVAALADDAAAQGDDASAAALAELQARLAALVPPEQARRAVLAELLAADEAGELDAAVAALGPALDYAFFVALADTIDAAPEDEAERLASLRERVLAAIDATDAAAREALQAAVTALREILAAPDPAAAVRRRLDSLSPAFLPVLEANLAAAEERGDAPASERLGEVYAAVVDVIEENLPPRERLVSRLARTTADAERAAVLDEQPTAVDDELLDGLRRTASAARSAGADEAAEALDRAADEVERRLRGQVVHP